MDFSKQFCFSTEIAKEAGLIPALVFECLAISIRESTAVKAKKCFKNGKYWGDLDSRWVQCILPFLSEHQIKQAFRKLETLLLIEIDEDETEKTCAFGETTKDYIPAYWAAKTMMHW